MKSKNRFFAFSEIAHGLGRVPSPLDTVFRRDDGVTALEKIPARFVSDVMPLRKLLQTDPASDSQSGTHPPRVTRCRTQTPDTAQPLPRFAFPRPRNRPETVSLEEGSGEEVAPFHG